MTENSTTLQITLEPADNHRLANLCGQYDENLKQIEKRLGVEIASRGNRFQIMGSCQPVEAASRIIHNLFQTASEETITPQHVHLSLQSSNVNALLEEENPQAPVVIRTRKMVIKARGNNQQQYLKNILSHDINFGIGPAGTGKTFLAVACAVAALEEETVKRLILTRPAVEAGERLGFLPGDLAQKVDPYLRPLYDALYDMLGFERVTKLIERNVIEIAPLAFMRGRTLNDSFIILDEAQNTTVEQLKMFLTRVGFGSTAVVTGDITQVDLPRDRLSGLKHVLEVLGNVKGISFTRFDANDVVRHPLVQRIVAAYEAHDKARAELAK